MDPALEGLGDVLLGSMLAVLGLAAVGLSLNRRRGVDSLLASFGFFSLLYGIRLVVANPMSPALGIPPFAAAMIESFITYLILVPAWFFFWKLLGSGWHSTLLWTLRLVTVFAVVGVVSDLIQGTPQTLTTLNNVVVIFGLLVAGLALWSCRRRMTTAHRILLAGFSVFGLLALNENLVPFGVLPWNWSNESIGFVVFVGCLGWIATRRYLATERNLASVEGELESATRIQASILPTHAPQIDGLSIAFRLRPSSAVAGDLFDFLPIGSGRLGIVIGDVSGHGVPAALIASMVKVALTSHIDLAHRPAEFLERVNRTLCGSFQHGFVSIAVLLLDLDTEEAVVGSGGHPFPLLQRRSEPTVREIGGGGPILGRFPQAAFREERLSLRTGDRLFLYTDGIVEAPNVQGEMFGEERLHRLLLESATLSTETLCDTLVQTLETWAGKLSDRPREDDLTFIVVDFHGRDRSTL